jgi:hypothetical protein
MTVGCGNDLQYEQVCFVVIHAELADFAFLAHSNKVRLKKFK